MTEDFLICIGTYGKKIRNQLMLNRLLSSLTILPNKFRVVIVNTNDSHNTKTTQGVNRLCSIYRKHFPIMQVTNYDTEFLRENIMRSGFNGLVHNIKLEGFSNFRNIMLLISRILGENIVVMLDDDEIVEDDKFADKATDFIGKKVRGRFLFGKTGYYINSNNTPYLAQMSPRIRKLWMKETYINEAIDRSILKKGRLNNTTMAFGGIMVLHEKLFSRIPFDPHISRGEDTDYCMNAKQFGYQFLMDKNFTIKHLPPRHKMKYWEKLRQDIYRYIYVKEKLKYFNNIHMNDLNPYPAHFLKDDLKYRAVVASINYAQSALRRNDLNFHKESFRNVEIVFKDATMNAVVNAPRYFEFQKNWVKLMKFAKQSSKLKKHFSRFE